MSDEENAMYSKKWHDLVNSTADEFDELELGVGGNAKQMLLVVELHIMINDSILEIVFFNLKDSLLYIFFTFLLYHIFI